MTDLSHNLPATDHQVVTAFGQGQCANYLADNPYVWGGELWEVWREGFHFQQRQADRAGVAA